MMSPNKLFNTDITVSGAITTTSGTFAQSLTVSGSPVLTSDSEIAGGGGGELTFSGAPRFLEPRRYWNPMIPPETPYTGVSGVDFNDEFYTDDSGVEEIDTNRWSVFDPGGDLSNNPPRLFEPDHLKLQCGGDPAARDIVGIYQSFVDDPTAPSFTIHTKVAIDVAPASADFYAGIMFLEDSTAPLTSNILLCGIRARASTLNPTFEIGIWEWSQYDGSIITTSTARDHIDGLALQSGVFLKIQRSGAAGLDRWNLHWSLDGLVGWRDAAQMTTTQASLSTFDAIGLCQKESGWGTGSAFHYFRVQSNNTNAAAAGRFAYVETDPTASGLNVSGTISGTSGGGGGGVSAHADLTGLSADDHPQYGQLSDAETAAGIWDFSNGLTVSGEPVSTGTGGGGGASTLQEAYDGGDGTIAITDGKPFELTSSGGLVAVTGTFTEGLTIGGASTVINGVAITTGSGIFDTTLTISGTPAHAGDIAAQAVVPTPTKEITTSTTLTAADEIILVNGPADDSPGFTPDIYSAEFSANSGDVMDSDIYDTGLMGIANTWTMSVWVRNTSITTGEDTICEFARSSGPTEIGRINIQSSQYEVDLVGNGYVYKEGVFGTPIVNQWQMVTVVWDGTQAEVNRVKAYVDGVEESISFSVNDSGFAFTDTARYFQVGHPNGPPYSFGGQAHSVMIWDVALNAANVTAIFNGGNGAGFNLEADSGSYTQSSALIHWWRLGFAGDTDPDLGVATVGGFDLLTTAGTVPRSSEYPGAADQVTVTLPDAASNSGKSYTITDKLGNASDLAIIISPSGSDTIDGASSDTISVSKGTKTYFSDGVSQWRVQGSTGSAGGTASTLQDAYDLGDGSVTTTAGKAFDVAGDLTTVTGTFSESLTISGVPVSTGAGGGASTLQEAYDGGDGTIAITDGKPFELTASGGLVAVTGTFTDGITIGEASTVLDGKSITTASGIFEEMILQGQPVSPSTLAFGDGFRGALVTTTTGVNYAWPASANALMYYDSVVYDTDGFFDVDGDQTIFTIPAGINKIRLIAGTKWETSLTGTRLLSPRRVSPSTITYAAETAQPPDDELTAFNHSISTQVIDVVEGETYGNLLAHWATIDLEVQTGNQTFFGIEVIDPVSTPNHLIVSSGTFSESLTISGVPVSTGTGGGTSDHSTLSNLDFASAAHTGFASEAELLTVSGHLQSEIDAVPGGGSSGTSSGTVEFRGALLTTSSGIDVVTGNPGTGLVGVPWDTEIYDTDGFHDSSDINKLVVPEGITKVQVSLMWRWDDNGAPLGNDQGRMVSILQNDSSGTPLQGYAVMAQPGMAGATELTGQNAITPVITVSGGESFVVSLRQHSGTTLSCDPAINRSWFSIEVIEPVTVTGIASVESSTPDPLVLASGVFSEVLTISGVPVSTGAVPPFRGAFVGLIEGGVTVDNLVKQPLSFYVDPAQNNYDTDGFLTASGADHFEIPAALDGSRVRLTGQILWGTSTVGNRTGMIRNHEGSGGTFPGAAYQTSAATKFLTYNMACPVVTVTGGEQFKLIAENGQAGAGGSGDTQTLSRGTQNWFAIEVVE